MGKSSRASASGGSYSEGVHLELFRGTEKVRGKKGTGQASQRSFWDTSPDLARRRAGNDMSEGRKQEGVKKDQQQERENTRFEG